MGTKNTRIEVILGAMTVPHAITDMKRLSHYEGILLDHSEGVLGFTNRLFIFTFLRKQDLADTMSFLLQQETPTGWMPLLNNTMMAPNAVSVQFNLDERMGGFIDKIKEKYKTNDKTRINIRNKGKA
jgi:hypothetical protein